MTHILWITAAILLGAAALGPFLYIGGRAVYESCKVSSWWSIIGGIALFIFLAWVASLGPHSPD